MFCAKNALDLVLSLADVSISSTPEMLLSPVLCWRSLCL